MLKAGPLHHESQGNNARLQLPIAKRRARDDVSPASAERVASQSNRRRKAAAKELPPNTMPSVSDPIATLRTSEKSTPTSRPSAESRPKKARAGRASFDTHRTNARPSPSILAPDQANVDLIPEVSVPCSGDPSTALTRHSLNDAHAVSASDAPSSSLSQATTTSCTTLPVSDGSDPSTADCGHSLVDYHPNAAAITPPLAATDRAKYPPESSIDVADTVAAIRELYHRRQDFLQEEGSLSRRIKKIVARLKGQMTATDAEVEEMSQTYGPLIPFLDSLKLLRTARLQEERKLKKRAEMLPVWGAFGAPIHGFGSLSLGAIIGESSDLNIYSNPAKLWKRMGLALIGGERQRKCVDKEKAEAHGYSPRRRSVMFVIGDNLVKGKSAYRDVYDKRKVCEVEKAKAEGLTVCPAAKIPKGKHAQYRSDGHVHLRAKRYMEKRLLRDLWRAWRDLRAFDTPAGGVVPCPPSNETLL